MIGDTAILLVDDHPENLLALEAILEPTGYRLVRARSGAEALKAMLQGEFAAILLDVQMPGLDGFETAELIRARERTRSVPIIFVTAISKAPENVFRGYGAGAVDYLFKPVDPVVLRSKVEVFGELYERGRALAEREELLRATFEDAPIGMARADADGRLQHVNRALTQALDRSAGDLLGRTLDELGPRADAGADAEQRERLLAGQIEQYEVQRRLTGPRGTTMPVLVSASLARSSGGGRPDLILHLQDLRERQRAQRDREQLIRAQAARAQAEATAERLRIMQSIAVAALGAEDLEELLRELLDRILEALDVDRAAVVLTDEARAVVARAAGGVDTVVGREARDRVDDIVDRVILDPTRPLAIPDVTAAGLDASSLGPAITSLLAVPLADGDRVIGSIHVGTLTRRDFDAETVALLRLAADRAGLAIARTRLYERERRIASELQTSLLPKLLPVVPGVVLDARYLPGVDGTTVGGDWYDAIALPSGRIALAIGDVVGRGISAAATMGQMRSALRAILMQADHTGAMADRLNRFAFGLGPEAVMTTVVLAILEPATGTLRYTNAGHPPPLLVGPDGSPRFLEDQPSPPMGVLASPRYPEHRAVLEPGSTLALYTDGLVESPTEVLDVGLERLLQAGRNAGPDVAATCERLLERGLHGGTRSDDVTLLAVRMSETLGDRVALEVSGQGGGLFAMRQTLRRWLAESGADEDEVEDIIMACNEACENSVEHGYNFGDDLFDVTFERDAGQVSIKIRDAGIWQPPQDEPHRGHGLPLIAKLMDAVDVQPRTGGTTVLMSRRLAAGADAQATVDGSVSARRT
ncbi:MAG TPA: SpoIIE family protein phosphatase [Solirubrobacteraceae bacterium]|nr:SpoIIE family protein phosphatase [Solirubrobacteraceae bacterium]